MAPSIRTKPVIQPNLGLHYDKSRLTVPLRALHEGLNFRVLEGRLNNRQVGWSRYSDFTLNGPVTLIDNLRTRDANEFLVFGTPTDLYTYDPNTDAVRYITPIYVTGTAAASGTSVTGTSTTWDASGIKAGDEISFGANDEDDPAATWYEIDAVGSDTAITLTATAGTVADGPYTIRRKFQGTASTVWDSDSFMAVGGTTDYWYATNGIDNPIKWDGSGSATYLSLGFTAKHLRVYSNMMIWANLVQSGEALPTDIVNSDIGDPEDVTTGLSEQFSIHAGADEIAALAVLGDNIVFYSLNHIVMAQFVGDPLIFAFRQASTEQGTIGPRLVANFGDHHKFLSLDGQYVFDGASIAGVGEQVWRNVLNSHDPTRTYAGLCHFDDQWSELIWAVPLVTDPATSVDLAYVEHYQENVDQQRGEPIPFSKRNFPFTAVGYYEQQSDITWDTATGTWDEATYSWTDPYYFASSPINLAGTSDGEVFLLNSGQTADGTALVSYVEFGKRPVIEGRRRGIVSRIYPYVESITGGTMTVTTMMSDHAEGADTISEANSFDLALNEGEFFVTPYRAGRYFAVKFGVDDATTQWEIDGYDYDARDGGYR